MLLKRALPIPGFYKGLRHHYHPRCAVSALEGRVLDEGGLKRMELDSFRDPLDGLQFASICPDREFDAR
jgi:hypothetical protein